MQLSDEVVAIACGDLHLSHKPPIARSVEKDWYEVMGRYIGQLRYLAKRFHCPVIVSGDWFDRPNNPAELVNFLLKELDFPIYGIPGQHDLPGHRYDNRKKSSYWTLVEARRVYNIEWNSGFDYITSYEVKGVTVYLHGVPWGFEIVERDPDDVKTGHLHIAVVHAYIWIEGKSYPGAPLDSRLKKFIPKLRGYDTAIFGDNHKGFLYEPKNGPPIFNCGTFIRRKIDEREYSPQVGLIHSSGRITPFALDCSDDNFLNVEGMETMADSLLGATDFINELAGIGRCAINFRDAVKEFCERNDVGSIVQSYLSDFMDD